MTARSVRDQMVDSAVILLAKHGLDGTSFTEVLGAGGDRGREQREFG